LFFKFAKMMQLFELESLSLVFGFDWFRGNHPEGEERELVEERSYFASFEDVEQLVREPQFDTIVRLVDINLATDTLSNSLAANEHPYFKIAMLDCGLYYVDKIV